MSQAYAFGKRLKPAPTRRECRHLNTAHLWVTFYSRRVSTHFPFPQAAARASLKGVNSERSSSNESTPTSTPPSMRPTLNKTARSFMDSFYAQEPSMPPPLQSSFKDCLSAEELSMPPLPAS